MKRFFQFKKLLLLLGDVFILYASLYITLLIRYQEIPTAQVWANHVWPFTIVFVVWIIIFYIADLYNLHLAVNNPKFFQKTNKSVIAAVIFALAFFYADPETKIAPKTNLLLYIAIFYILFFLWRRLYNRSLKSYLPKKNIAIIGYDNQVEKLIEELKEKPHLGYVISFILDDKNENRENEINGIKIINGIENLKNAVLENKIDTIVLSSDPNKSDELRTSLFNCIYLKINYIGLPDFYENITGKIPIDTIGEMWFLENLSEADKIWFDSFKRIYDVILALLLFLITLPFWLIIAAIIKIESRGPVFFIMKRAGKDDRNFKLIKFRTMREEGNDRSLTTENDARVTKFGKFLRKTRIDEIPQVINILKGDMSFIGPRPERPEYVIELENAIPFYKERMLIKPGLTGWDQISGEYHSPTVEDSLKKLQYDLYYIKNRSVYLDISIILKTIATVLSRGGL